jgi:hypothetical protein
MIRSRVSVDRISRAQKAVLSPSLVSEALPPLTPPLSVLTELAA